MTEEKKNLKIGAKKIIVLWSIQLGLVFSAIALTAIAFGFCS